VVDAAGPNDGSLAINGISRRFQGLWRQPDFIRLWLGQTVSLLGSSVSALALPLVAVLTLHASASQMGVLYFLNRAPYLFFALLFGGWVDRVRRRRLLIWTDVARGLLMVSIPLAALLQVLTIEAFWLIALLIAAATLVFELAYRAYLPGLVGRELILEANSRLEVSSSTASLVGPPLAGLLVQVLTAPIAVLVDAISFFISSLSLGLIEGPEALSRSGVARSLRNELKAGLAFLFGHPILRLLMVMTATFNFFMMSYVSLSLLYQVRELRLSALQIGILGGVGALGALFGAALVPALNRRLGVGRTLIAARVLMQLGLVATPATFGSPTLILSMLAAGGLLFGSGINLSNITQTSYRQTLVPDSLQARVHAAQLQVVFGSSALGALAAGWLGQLAGLRPTLWLAVAGTTLPLLMLLASPVARER